MTRRTVLVTGGARGIGRGIAESFLRVNHNVVIADLDSAGDWRYPLASESELTDTAKELSNLGDIHRIVLDVTSAESCISCVQQTIEAFGSLDVLINNAGVVDSGPIDTFTEEQWDRIFEVNVKGIFLMTQAAVPELRKSGRCRDRKYRIHCRQARCGTNGRLLRIEIRGCRYYTIIRFGISTRRNSGECDLSRHGRYSNVARSSHGEPRRIGV